MHYESPHHASPHYDTFHYLVRDGVIITPPVTGGGSIGESYLPGENYYNQAPPKYIAPSKKEDPYLAQALQEDEDLLLILTSFIKVIQCH